MRIECLTCNANVIPKKNIAIEWVIFWVIVFFPAAIIYVITRQPKQCPSCGANVFGSLNPSNSQDHTPTLQDDIDSEVSVNGKPEKVQNSANSQTNAIEHKTRSFSRREFKLAIVGESHYLNTLQQANKSVKDYAGVGYIDVLLTREPENEYDENAIRVMTTDLKTIGYLSRAKAKSYQVAFSLWEKEGYLMKCQAKLIGGDKKKKNIGAWLDLDTSKTIEFKFHDPRTRK